MNRLSAEQLAVASPEELAVYKEWLERQTNLVTLWDYMQAADSDVKDYPFTLLLCRWVDALLEGRLYRSGPGPLPIDGKHPFTDEPVVYNLQVSAPPRHSKSFAMSDFLPSYALTKLGKLKVAFSTYEANFAFRWSAKSRDRVHSLERSFGVGVVGGLQAAREAWQTTAGGEYKAAGAGGPITGHGWQLGICDDPIKNAEEAGSPTERDNLHDWWQSVWWTRRERWHDGTPARALLILTRWNVDDIASRVVDDTWAVLRVPALSEGDGDPLDRPEGAALCDDVMTKEELEELRNRSPQWFASMYQGSPFLDGGNIIHDPFNLAQIDSVTQGYALKLRDGARISVPVADCYRFGVVDLAASLKKTADWTVVTTFDVTSTRPRRLIARDLKRFRLQTQDHEGEIAREYQRQRMKFLAIEDITFGTSLLNNLRQRGDMILRPVRPIKDKITRALPLDSLIRDELLWWMEDAAWRMDLEQEVLAFPDAAHDDIVDTLAYGAEIFRTIPQIRDKKRGWTSISEYEAEQIAKRKDSSRRKYVNHPLLGRIRT